jgi:hypothetical protein
MIYTFGDAATTWICVRIQSGIYADSTKWAEFDRQATSIVQLNDSLLSRGVPCIFHDIQYHLKVYCKNQSAQTMLLLSIPSGLLCGEPRTGAHIVDHPLDQLLTVADACGLKYTKSKPRKFVI